MSEERRLREFVGEIPQWAADAETFFVDSGMVPLVCSAGAVVPDATALAEHDLPSPVGFLLIGGGITLCHLQGEGEDGPISAEAFTAYLWAAEKVGVHVLRFERAPGRWFLVDSVTIPWGAAIPEPARARDRGFARRLVIPGGQPDTDHESVALPIGPEARELMSAPESQRSDAALCWLVACWRLMGQVVADVRVDVPSRQVRRQVARKNVPLKDVTVIRLRHVASRGTGEAAVNWSHRWLVRGHWRQQRCKDYSGAWTTRPVFIHPYIKGPEEAPLLSRRHVNHLVR